MVVPVLPPRARLTTCVAGPSSTLSTSSRPHTASRWPVVTGAEPDPSLQSYFADELTVRLGDWDVNSELELYQVRVVLLAT